MRYDTAGQPMNDLWNDTRASNIDGNSNSNSMPPPPPRAPLMRSSYRPNDTAHDAVMAIQLADEEFTRELYEADTAAHNAEFQTNINNTNVLNIMPNAFDISAYNDDNIDEHALFGDSDDEHGTPFKLAPLVPQRFRVAALPPEEARPRKKRVIKIDPESDTVTEKAVAVEALD